MTVTGTLHSIAMLDPALKERILDFYAKTLTPTELPQEPATDDADAVAGATP